MLIGQLLTVLALHDRPMIVKRIEGKVIQVAEWVKHKLGLPLHGEVSLILNRIAIPLEEIWLQFVVRLARHFGKALIASTLVDREYQKDWVSAALEGFYKLTCRAVGCGPHTMLETSFYRVQIDTLHDEEAS